MTTNTHSIGSDPLPVTLRWIAGIGGAGIIGTVTWANVTATGGMFSATAPSLIAHAFGLVIGAACVGVALRHGRYVLGGLIAIMLITGEAYTLMNTGERELESRELRQAPNKMADAKRKAIEADIAMGEAALAGLTSHRLSQAEQVLSRIELSSIEASTKKDCWKLCKQRLDDSVASARKDVDAARAELNAERAGILAKIEAHKAEIAAIPVVAALSPLAARLGVPDWKLDLIRAGLFTLSANGLGGFLLVFAAHGRRREVKVIEAAKAVEVEATPETKMLSFENESGDRPQQEIDELRKLFGQLEEILAKAEWLNNQDAAKATGFSPGHMSRLRQKLEAAGLVTSDKVGKEVRIRLASSNGRRVAA